MVQTKASSTIQFLVVYGNKYKIVSDTAFIKPAYRKTLAGVRAHIKRNGIRSATVINRNTNAVFVLTLKSDGMGYSVKKI